MQTFTSLIEEWKPVEGFPDYEVSNCGNVRSVDRKRAYRHGLRTVKGKMLKPLPNPKRGGYQCVELCDKSKHYHFQIHRLVASAFIPNPEGKPQVNHIDCNPSNNCVENLEWVTPKENSAWMIACGRQNITTEKPIMATNPKTGEKLFFKSSMDAKRCGYDRPAIWRCITGEYKTHRGLIWSYTVGGE